MQPAARITDCFQQCLPGAPSNDYKWLEQRCRELAEENERLHKKLREQEQGEKGNGGGGGNPPMLSKKSGLG